MSDCIEGCKVKNHHVTDCPDRDTCPGCEPRPAVFGLLCPWDWQRLHADIVDSPALVRYLWALAHCGTTSAPSDTHIRHGDPAERNILHGALDALDGLHACLASWAHVILEEHPNGAQMAGPDENGTRRTNTVAILNTEIAWKYGPYLRKTQVAGVRDPEATSRLVKWLLPQLGWCAEQDWVGEMRREIGDVVRTTAARFPVNERTRAIPGVECPNCGRVSLAYDPPTLERQSAQVNCTTPGCGIVYTTDQFTRLVKIIEWEHEQIGARV